MSTSDVVSLIANIASIVGVATAVIVAWSAKADAKASAAEAARSREIASDSRDAQVRMADALERSNRGPADDGSGGASGPDVEFLIERRGKNLLALRNLGPARATGVTIPEGQGGITRNLPVDESLDPFQSHEFMIFGAMQTRVPGEVKVIADRAPDGVRVQIPPSL